jgi:hypothetical protein
MSLAEMSKFQTNNATHPRATVATAFNMEEKNALKRLPPAPPFPELKPIL